MRRSLRSARGQTLMEFAIVAPLLFLLVFGVIDFGLGLSRWIVLTNAAREGARLGATGKTPEQVEAQTITASSGLLEGSNVTVDYRDVGGNGYPADGGDAVVVRVSYQYDLISPLAALLQRDSFTLSACSEMRLERGILDIVSEETAC